MIRHASRAIVHAIALLPTLATSCAIAGHFVPPSDGPGGMMCDYYDFALRIPWQGGTPRSIDAKGVVNGDAAFATQRVNEAAPRVTFDVTEALLASRRGVPGALLLRAASARDGKALFASRESEEAKRPRLTVVTNDGRQVTATPVADSVIDCSTSNPLGKLPGFFVGPHHSAILRFEVGEIPADIRSATLSLELQRADGPGTISVYALALPVDPAVPEETRGLATDHPGDRGIESDPDVMFAEQFEAPDWWRRWSALDFRSRAALTADDEAHGFRALRGRALQVTVAKGANLALDLRYRLGNKAPEPTEAYFRYYLRFGDDWGSDVDGGKLPGLSGTYGRAGWGGRDPDGHNGWNMRMTFAQRPPPGHSGRDLVAVGTEAALPPQRTSIARENAAPRWPWTNGFLGVLEKNRWYCIEQHVRLNAPGASDGVFEAWVDGELAITRSNVDYRYDSGLRIQEIWLDIYHGGTAPAAQEQHIYIDNVVVARRYIGPMAN